VRVLSSGYRPPGIAQRSRDHVRLNGTRRVAGHAVRWLGQYARGLPSTATGSAGRFTVAGSDYRYLAHRYNWTWLNERAVEVPIAQAAVSRAAGARILEVGHVLGHYGPTSHTVIDRYEHASGVINADALEFRDEDGFDLIVSVSTLEHVGWDEAPRDPDAAAAAFGHLRGLLRPGGELLATVPVGYNPALDSALRAGRVALDELRALRREPARNVWREVPPEAVWDAGYDFMLYTAHGLVVCRARG
jgi:SAM-dependent methyltransferase